MGEASKDTLMFRRASVEMLDSLRIGVFLDLSDSSVDRVDGQKH